MLTRTKAHVSFSLVVIIALVFGFSITVYGLTPSNTTTTANRNYIAKNWTFSSQGYREQNCLSYALDKGAVWTWPWGGANPTKAQAQAYLKTPLAGYSTFYNGGPIASPNIVAYTKDGGVTHFLKMTSSGKFLAKWGSNEIFQHSGNNQYTNNVYGTLCFIARK